MITFNHPDETLAWAAAWSKTVAPGEIIALHGTLGAGKTVIARGLARGLGFVGDVTSPTYTLLHEYHGGRMPLYHFDLYRLQGEAEAARSGMEEYLPSDGLTVVEWPERIAALLPAHTRHWRIEVVSETGRRMTTEPDDSCS